MLKIWGRVNSINVQKVMWTVGELKLSHERIDAGGAFGKVKDPDYVRMNPNSLVPTIDDNGFILWESNAIVRYLTGQHAYGVLFPADLQVRASADRWMDWSTTTVLPAMFPAFWGLIRTPPEKRNAAAIEESRVKLEGLMRIFDEHLAGRDFVEGPSFSIADIPMGAVANRWYALPIERPTLGNLEAWFGRLKDREAYRTHVSGIPLT